MNEALDNRLISLLERHLEQLNVSDCLEAIKGKEEVRYGSSYDDNKLLPLKETIDIYRVRERINAELNDGVIKGYETLLPALENASVQDVRIKSLELLSKWYVIFTDSTFSELFGILDCPKEKAAWFNPETGYD